MNSRFKSIIFLYLYNEKAEDLKLITNSLKGVNSFQTNDLEEVKQIIDMSEKSCIISDDFTNILAAHEEHLKFVAGKHKIFVVDWEENLTPNEFHILQIKGISFFKGKQLIAVMERLQAYLMGKFRLNASFENDNNDLPKIARQFITIIESKENRPQIIASTHEQFEDINNLIGDNWDDILYNGIDSVSQNTELKEGKLKRGDFYQIVVRADEAEVKRLALVHIKIDYQLNNNIQKIKNFLSEKMKELI